MTVSNHQRDCPSAASQLMSEGLPISAHSSGFHTRGSEWCFSPVVRCCAAVGWGVTVICKTHISARFYLLEDGHGACPVHFIFLLSCVSQLDHFSIFVSLWLGRFSSAIHCVSGRTLVLFFTGNDVTFNITTHFAKYTPKGTLHGNHKVSLSRGFVKCNIQRGQGCHKEGDISVAALLKESAFSTLRPQMSLIQITI